MYYTVKIKVKYNYRLYLHYNIVQGDSCRVISQSRSNLYRLLSKYLNYVCYMGSSFNFSRVSTWTVTLHFLSIVCIYIWHKDKSVFAIVIIIIVMCIVDYIQWNLPIMTPQGIYDFVPYKGVQLYMHQGKIKPVFYEGTPL